MVIKGSTLDALCKEAGLELTRVLYAQITPKEVTFEVYSVGLHDSRLVRGTGDECYCVTHWVKVPVAW
jgi:hypothetical protein